MITVKHRNRLLCGRVRACVGFGQTERTEFFTLGKGNEILLLLLFGAVCKDGITGKRRVCAEDD